MALKQSQQLKLQQKLSPQQIQLMKLIQLPIIALEQRIKEELEENPALEEENEHQTEDDFSGEDNTDFTSEENDHESSEAEENSRQNDDIAYEDYVDEDEFSDFKYQINNSGKDSETREIPIKDGMDFHDVLEEQLGLLDLSETQYIIGLYLIGCIEDDGYIRRDTHSLVDDLAFTQNITATDAEVETLIHTLQSLDPAGIAARNLQECLLLQLERHPNKTREIHHAIDIVKNCMDEFSKKHYEKIIRKLAISEEDLKEALHEITKLNPKPGSTSGQAAENVQEIIPDFVLSNTDGELELALTSRNLPDLKISDDYLEMLTRYNKEKDKTAKEASGFIKNKIENAQWFIDALLQRKQTLLIAMNAIMKYQKEYFLSGDETKLKPMILKDIAEKVGLDISTISRVANSKYITTPFGTFPLKFFFSESLSTESGEEVSSREVKKILSDFIHTEDKRHPLTDDALGKMLKEKGYNIARRTIAKYREQLDIPVARMRKQI
ncbi:MAG: RNA polymerase factor sigma-54 [Bacteroidetes bacterium]|nr:RNA polymerase factor sigma-54 [Bacteroidota bacterium]